MNSGPIEVGALVDARYRLEEEIGRGGMSVVYRATDVKFDLPVAIKLSAPTSDVAEFKARFKREALIGRMLGGRSSAFVRAQDWGTHGGFLFLAMDYVAGAADLDLLSGELGERLERYVRICKLVREVHSMRIVHRDLKPQNCLTSADGRIFLADFGLAKLLDSGEDPVLEGALGSVTQSGMAIGTPYYMAPEQIDDAKSVDERADVYALGVMLHLLLAGELPYTGSMVDLLRAQAEVAVGKRPPPSPRRMQPSVPPPLDELCQRALELDPEHRLPTVQALLFGLGLEEDGEATSLSRGFPTLKKRKTKKRKLARKRPSDSGDLEFMTVAQPAPTQHPAPVGPDAVTEQQPARPSRRVPTDPQTQLLRHLRKMLPTFTRSVALKGQEIKFVHGANRVGISFLSVENTANWGFFEHRLKLSVSKLKGQPTGLSNLMLAANMINLNALGLRCVISPSRLRFRRELWFGPQPPTRIEVERHLELFRLTWAPVFKAMLEVQKGRPWHEALAFLVVSPTRTQERLLAVQEVLNDGGIDAEHLPGELLGVGKGEGQVLVSCVDDEIHAAQRVHPWTTSKEEARAVRAGEHAPEVERLIGELNDINHGTFYTLALDPKRGIVARAQLTQPGRIQPKDLIGFLEALDLARLEHEFSDHA